MYLVLSRRNSRSAMINDDGWGYVKALNSRWERVDSGVWLNIDTGEEAVRQDDGNWTISGRRYKCIKKLMLAESLGMQTA